MAKKESTPRVVRTIQSMVDMEIPLVVKSSVYPWDSLIPQDGDDSDGPARNFFVEYEDEAAATKGRSSIYQSGKNYYDKRRMDFAPLCRVALVGDTYGVGCWAVPPVA